MRSYVVMFVCDIILSVIVTLPFSLFTQVWTYWLYALIVIVGLQLFLTVLILINGKNKGGN